MSISTETYYNGMVYNEADFGEGVLFANSSSSANLTALQNSVNSLLITTSGIGYTASPATTTLTNQFVSILPTTVANTDVQTVLIKRNGGYSGGTTGNTNSCLKLYNVISNANCLTVERCLSMQLDNPPRPKGKDCTAILCTVSPFGQLCDYLIYLILAGFLRIKKSAHGNIPRKPLKFSRDEVPTLATPL
jgi:hypothetical protein